MRATIRPVSLSRIAEVVDICSRGEVSKEDLEDSLNTSSGRVNEVTAEMERMGLIQGDELFVLTDLGVTLRESLKNEKWESVHEVLYEASPHYRTFVDFFSQRQSESGLTEEEIVGALEDTDEDLKFNATGVSLLTDWAERLGAIQRNVFQGRYYWVAEDFEGSFTRILQETYSEVEVERGVNLRQRYVSIPRLREKICETLSISRSEFDEMLNQVYFENIGDMELSGAPLNTQAKETSVGIKTIEKDDSGSITTTKMSSEKILDGITLEDGKMYYYLSIFTELNGDV
jgi:RNase P/RNase MRP subunit POP5